MEWPVSTCHACPLHSEAGCEPWCGHPCLESPPIGDDWNADTCPKWCPLRIDTLTLRLDGISRETPRMCRS